MDFTFDELQDDLRGLASRILSEKVTPARLKELEAGDDLDRHLWGELAKANLLGAALPEDAGGSGFGFMELGVLLEEVGAHVAPVPVLPVVGIAGMTIAEHGSDEQQASHLPGIIDGSTIVTAAVQEGIDADPLAPHTTARRTGASWKLRGRKVGVPYGAVADRILVTASTQGGAVGAFLVDPEADGVVLEATRATHREPQVNLFLDDAAVPDSGVIGDPTEGLAIAAFIHRHALAGLCAMATGTFERALRITADYISEREQFGKPLATFQGATLKAADAYIDVEAIRIATWSAIWRLADGRDCDEALAMAKFWVADGGQRVAAICQHLHGGMGVDVDYPIHRYFLWAKHLELTLGGATSQLLRIGEVLAGERA